jgi:hypothetical protein
MEGIDRERLKERILNRREISPTGCWLWTGSRDANGYGHIRVGERVLLVHRVAAAVFFSDFDLYGEICCLHNCDNPPCFNPEHLYTGTQADNIADRETRHRRNLRGSEIGTSKLTEDQVTQIIRALQTGERQSDVARRIGIGKVAVNAIAKRRSWRHVLPQDEIPTSPARGARHPCARLSDEQVDEIRAAVAGGQTQVSVARRFGIHQSHVSAIVNRRRRVDR